MILETVKSPADIKKLTESELETLAGEIRQTIINTVSKNGGHLASNLGVVELTLALHRVFDSPKDRIIFDVGHQCYTHKLITGRYEGFEGLRKTGGISGFLRRDESEHDFFGSAHSSNSISMAIGLATAAKLKNESSATVAVIGDGAFTGGMVYEALNNCVDKSLNLVIVLNVNEMSISPNVGNINNYFSRFRMSKSYFRFKKGFVGMLARIPGKSLYNFFRSVKNKLKRLVLKENLFEILDLEYYGPLDGNNLGGLEQLFKEIKSRNGGITVVQVKTKKGLGYAPAEQNPDVYHSVGKFEAQKGVSLEPKTDNFSYRFGSSLTELAKNDESICAVTAAMTSGTGLGEFARTYPDRFFDVGIAEEHAATFCAGLSAGGKKPVFAVYSTFLQRCIDQIIMDISLQGLSAVFAIDRAGLVGDDGPTHHGVFDVPLLLNVPGICVYSPDCFEELKPCLEKCLAHKGVSALRYPRGGESEYDKAPYIDKNGIYYADFGVPETCIITYGRLTAQCDKAARASGKGVRVIRLVKIAPLDIDTLFELIKGMKHIIIAEEGAKNGGVSASVALSLCEKGADSKVTVIAPDDFVPHGGLDDILDSIGLSSKKIAEVI